MQPARRQAAEIAVRTRGRRSAWAQRQLEAQLLLSVLALSVLAAAAPCHAVAQGTPEETAQRFFEALRRLRWKQVAAELHTAALDDFHLISRQLVESLRGDSILIQLYDASPEEWESWSSREVFERSMTGLARYARGLMESQVMTDFRVLGTVAEGDTIRHVVYRETTDHMGTVIEAAPTTTLVLEEERWRVRENPELGVLRVALRGIPIGRRNPRATGCRQPLGARGGFATGCSAVPAEPSAVP